MYEGQPRTIEVNDGDTEPTYGYASPAEWSAPWEEPVNTEKDSREADREIGQKVQSAAEAQEEEAKKIIYVDIPQDKTADTVLRDEFKRVTGEDYSDELSGSENYTITVSGDSAHDDDGLSETMTRYAIEEREKPAESNTEKEKSLEEEQQQIEDLQVLFSICDEEDALEILNSDSYGVLLKNKVSLEDLFGASALFNEQYYSDGYTKDYYWRVGSPIPAVKKDERQRHKRYGAADFLDDDIVRAKETRDTIDQLAWLYFSDGASEAKAKEIKDIIRKRADGEEDLSDEQKAFLLEEQNEIADRLLYKGHVVNEERAANILNGLSRAEKLFNDKEDGGTGLVSRMAYARRAMEDYIEAGRADLIWDAQDKLSDMVDEHFDILVSTDRICDDLDWSCSEIGELVFGYSNPYLLAERVKEYNLLDERRYDEHGLYSMFGDADRIVRYIATGSRTIKHRDDETVFISKNARALKELGVSDNAILLECHGLHPVDFIDAKSDPDGSGARLIEAGIDRKSIIKEVFSSAGRKVEPFEKAEFYPFNGSESYVEILERNGFEMTDIAKTFAPDAIARNLSEFLEKGADAKELVKYMAGYREEFEDNIIRSEGGGIWGYHRMWFDGMRNMMVWNENYPEGITIYKEGMKGEGVDFIADNFETFAKNGVTEEDIIGSISGRYTQPFGTFIPEMVRCGSFDVQKVLDLGFQKYTKYLKDMEEAGVFDKEYVDEESNQRNYFSEIIKKLAQQK